MRRWQRRGEERRDEARRKRPAPRVQVDRAGIVHRSVRDLERVHGPGEVIRGKQRHIAETVA